MPSILFVCTANKFRSPIAAACLTQIIEDRQAAAEWIVASAGTWTKPGIVMPHPARLVSSYMAHPGLENHTTRQVDQEMLYRFDLIVVMETGHKEALASEFPLIRKHLYLLAELVDGIRYDIPDPVNPEVSLREVAAELYELVARGADKILQLAQTLYNEKSLGQDHLNAAIF